MEKAEISALSRLENIGIILDRTRHAANIGSVCRVMKNLGLKKLHLVSPTTIGHLAAIRLIQGAEDILEAAPIHASLDEAVAGYHVVFPTSRKMKNEKAYGLAEASAQIADLAQKNRVALLFGSEKMGLAREAVDKCANVITLPVEPQFPSVNLALSVGMVCLEVRLRLWEMENKPCNSKNNPEIYLTMEKRHRLYAEFNDLFTTLGFDTPSIYGKIQNVFERANINEWEYNLFMGLIKELRRKADRAF